MKQKITIGRNPENDLIINANGVSGNHAIAYRQGRKIIIEDIGSTNGIYINRRKIRKLVIRKSDAVTLGKYAKLPVAELYSQLGIKVKKLRKPPRKRPVHRNLAAKELHIRTKSRITIGRAIDNDIVIKDNGVSRYHAALENNGRNWVLRDLNSVNGVYVDGNRTYETNISKKSRISLGSYNLNLQNYSVFSINRKNPKRIRTYSHRHKGSGAGLWIALAASLILFLGGGGVGAYYGIPWFKMKKVYDAAVQANTEQAYYSFLNEYPDSTYANQARAAMDELYFARAERKYQQAAQSGNPMIALHSFIAEFNDSPLAQRAQEDLKQMRISELGSLIRHRNLNGLQNFAATWNGYPEVEDAQRVIASIEDEIIRKREKEREQQQIAIENKQLRVQAEQIEYSRKEAARAHKLAQRAMAVQEQMQFQAAVQTTGNALYNIIDGTANLIGACRR